LQDAAEGREMFSWPLAFAIGRVAKQHRRGFFAGGRAVVAHIGPQPAGLGTTASRIQHRHRCVVGVELVSRHHVARQRLEQWINEPETASDPLGHRGTLQLDTFARVNLHLPIQRQVVGVFGDQHVREQPRSGKATLDRPRRRCHLYDALALRAGELRAHVLGHAEARRHVFENLGHVLADLAHRRPTVGAGTRRGVFDARARQVLG
jgi:hypothetical protein